MVENIAIFLNENLIKIGSKKFESTDDFITWKKGTFNIRLNAYLYQDGNTVYYAYIYPTDEKLIIDINIEPITKSDLPSDAKIDIKDKNKYSARLVKLKEKIEKGDLKLIMGEGIIGQLARMAVLGLKTNWVLILIVAVAVGLGAGGFAYTYGHNTGYDAGFATAKDLMNSTITRMLPVPTPTKVFP